MKFKDWNGKEYDLPKGKQFSWRPSAYALITKEDKVLLIKARQHGRWELPGGGIELGELVTDGLIREVFEETGYKIKLENNCPVYFENNFFYAPDINDFFETLPLVFLAKLESINQIKSYIDFENEVYEIKWVPLNELHKFELQPISLQAIKQLDITKKS